MHIASNLGQCSTSAKLTAQLEQRDIVAKCVKNLEDDSESEIPGFTLVPWRVFSQCLSNTGLVYLPVNSLSFPPPCHLQCKVASSSLLLLQPDTHWHVFVAFVSAHHGPRSLDVWHPVLCLSSGIVEKVEGGGEDCRWLVCTPLQHFSSQVCLNMLLHEIEWSK